VKKVAWLVLIVFCFLGGLLVFWGIKPPSRALFTKGLSCFEGGDYAGALSHWQEALIDQPDNPLLYYNIGNAYYRQEDYGNAQEFYRQDTPTGGIDTWRRYNLGNTLYRLGEQDQQSMMERFTEALECYRAVIIDDPTDLDAKINYEFIRDKLKQAENEQEGSPEQSEGESQDEEEQQEESQGEGQQDASPPQEQSAETPQDQGEMTYEEALRLLEYLNVQEGELKVDPKTFPQGTDTEYYW
jgi:Ca-activated chloride channel family protein